MPQLGEIFSKTVADSLARGKKASGDLIPWNISEQLGDRDFPKLPDARIVRIATHPNCDWEKDDLFDDDENEGIQEIEEEDVGLL